MRKLLLVLFLVGCTDYNDIVWVDTIDPKEPAKPTIEQGDRSYILAWDPVTTNVDGSPCTDLAGYKVYWGKAPREYEGSHDCGNRTSIEIRLAWGLWYFAATAYDTSGNESDYSEEVMSEP